MGTPVLHLRDLRFQWPGQTHFQLTVPKLDLASSQTTLLLGESGSGKSTLLSLICGTILPDAGLIEVDGTDITKLPGTARDRFRAEKIGVIFQQFNLLPFGSVQDNIQLPLRFAPERRRRVSDPAHRAAEICHDLGLPGDVMGTKAGDLSVGQQQRVAVARALIGEPPLIIADEPTSALDAMSQSAFLDLMFHQVSSLGTSLLMVSHDPRLGDRFDHVIRLEDIAQIERAAS